MILVIALIGGCESIPKKYSLNYLENNTNKSKESGVEKNGKTDYEHRRFLQQFRK